MTTVFIAGSISISRIHEKVQERISKIASSDFKVVVGDADGADTSIQQCLLDARANNVTVYCTGERPRNNVADWPVHRVHSKAKQGTRAYFTAKDLEMARSSDYGLMIWDCKSTGTLSNVLELLREKKKSVVFVNKNKDFVTIANKDDLGSLLTFMSEHARIKAEEKIGLSAKIAELDQEHLSFGIFDNEKPTLSSIREDTLPFSAAMISTAQGASMKLRLELMSRLRDFISHSHLSQSQAAEVLGVTQPQVFDLTRGKVDLLGLDILVNMASAAGLNVEIRIL